MYHLRDFFPNKKGIIIPNPTHVIREFVRRAEAVIKIIIKNMILDLRYSFDLSFSFNNAMLKGHIIVNQALA